jgi:hypothetical protein
MHMLVIARYLDEDITTLYGRIHSDDPQLSLKQRSLSVRNALSRNKQLANVQGLYVLVDEYDAFTNDFLN